MTYTNAKLTAALIAAFGFSRVFISRDRTNVQGFKSGGWVSLGHFGQACLALETKVAS